MRCCDELREVSLTKTGSATSRCMLQVEGSMFGKVSSIEYGVFQLLCDSWISRSWKNDGTRLISTSTCYSCFILVPPS